MIHVVALLDAVKSNNDYNRHVRPNTCNSYSSSRRGLQHILPEFSYH